MCDCDGPRCERCATSVPLHIADFCMPREDIAVFCANHLPRRNVVVYETVGETFHPDARRAPDRVFYRDPPKGWRMGVRFEGELRELVLALEAIARPVYRDYGLRLPGFQGFFDGLRTRLHANRFFSIHIRPDEREIWLGYENGAGKFKFTRRKITRV